MINSRDNNWQSQFKLLEPSGELVSRIQQLPQRELNDLAEAEPDHLEIYSSHNQLTVPLVSAAVLGGVTAVALGVLGAYRRKAVKHSRSLLGQSVQALNGRNLIRRQRSGSATTL